MGSAFPSAGPLRPYCGALAGNEPAAVRGGPAPSEAIPRNDDGNRKEPSREKAAPTDERLTAVSGGAGDPTGAAASL